MDKQSTALKEIKEMSCVTITPAQAAAVLRCTPQYIRVAAREDPKKLGFPVLVLGNRVKIYRIPFIRALEGEYAKEGN